MSKLWAARTPVVCLHPGSTAIVGRDAVLESWKQILRGSTDMRCDDPSVQLLGEAAVVTCYEGNGSKPAHLAATNVFVLEEGEWRMVLHQAGPLTTPRPRAAAPRVVN
jgi:hypothetical protein